MAEPPSHRFRLRVYYEDTDAAGIVYYANYLRYAERARSELMRELGVESSQLMAEHGVALAVRRCEIDYLKPAVLDDDLVVETAIRKIGGASLDALQTVQRDEVDLVRMDIRLGCMARDGGVARMPRHVRDTLTAYMRAGSSQ